MAKVATQIDLDSKTTWPITLGESITATKKAARLTSIRYNYQPRLDKSSAQREVRQTAGGKVTGTIKEKEQQWNYNGTQDDGQSDSYVLILRNDGSNKATLEKLDTVALNITSTPVEKDAGKLKAKYKQLSVQDDIQAVADDETTKPDEDNPFDYRHFLEDSPQPSEPTKSTTGTPLQRPAVSTPATMPKRKTVTTTTTTSTKRSKTEASAPRIKKTSQKVPEVRLERKASMRPSAQDEDDGMLIVEGDDDDNAPHARSLGGNRQSAMAMALNGNLGGRPISLHSAASSPVGIHSPAPERPRHEDEEVDLGGDEYEMEAAGHDDGDVEEFDLPSPVQKTSRVALPPVEIDDDDVDDFDRELAAAMQDDDEPAVQQIQEEEESEEE